MAESIIAQIRKELLAGKWRESREAWMRANRMRISLGKLPVRGGSAAIIVAISVRLTKLVNCAIELEQMSTFARVIRHGAILQQNDPTLGSICARYAVGVERGAFNDAVALKNSAVSLLWLKRLRLGRALHVPSLYVKFNPRPGDQYKREVHAHRWIYLSDGELVETRWPAMHLACIKGFDRVVLCLWREFGAARRDVTRDMVTVRNFAAVTAVEMAYIEENVPALRVLHKFYGVRRIDLVQGRYTCFPEEPTLAGTREVARLFAFTEPDLMAFIHRACTQSYYPASQNLRYVKNITGAVSHFPIIDRVADITTWTWFHQLRLLEIIAAAVSTDYRHTRQY